MPRNRQPSGAPPGRARSGAARWLVAVGAAVGLHAAALGLWRLPAPAEAIFVPPPPPTTGPRLTYWRRPPAVREGDRAIPRTSRPPRQVSIRRQRVIHRPPSGPSPTARPLAPAPPPLLRLGTQPAPPLPPLLAALAAADRAPRGVIRQGRVSIEVGFAADRATAAGWLRDSPPEIIVGLDSEPPAVDGWTWRRLPATDRRLTRPHEIGGWLRESGEAVQAGESARRRAVYLPGVVWAGWEARRPAALDLWDNLVAARGRS